MTFGDQLARLRKENNYTQEQLAHILGVSRQAVSKWESDAAYPETDKLIRMSELFGCSVDRLLRGAEDGSAEMGGTGEYSAAAGTEAAGYGEHGPVLLPRRLRERRSKRTVWGMPLWHIARHARGVVAVGLDARGMVAVGMRARGVISFGLLAAGGVSFGLLSLGGLSVGLLALGLLSAGCFSAGVLAAGAVSLGVVSLGAVALGDFSAGALAVGRYIAVGDHARAMIALGDTRASGSLYQTCGPLTPQEVTAVKALLESCVPSYLAWAMALFAAFL